MPAAVSSQDVSIPRINGCRIDGFLSASVRHVRVAGVASQNRALDSSVKQKYHRVQSCAASIPDLV